MKNKIRLLSILLSLSLLSGCNVNFRGEKNNKSTGEIKNFHIDDTKEISEENLEKLIDECIDYYKNIQYEYRYESLYLSDEDIIEIIKKQKTTQECDNKTILSVPELVSIIKENSHNFSYNSDNLMSSFELTIDNNEKAFEIALERCLNNIIRKSNNNIYEDICKSKSLSICYGDISEIIDTNFASGYYDYENNTIILDLDVIWMEFFGLKGVFEQYGKYHLTLTDVLERTLMHELDHVRQFSCDCRINKGQEYTDITYTDYIPFFIESSAESYIVNLDEYLDLSKSLKSYIYTYEDLREKETYILLLGLFNKNLDDYYNAIFDTDLNKLFSFANVNDYKSIKEFFKILYSLDALCLRNELVINVLKSDNILENDIKLVVGYEYRYELFNMFIINLLEYMKGNKEFSLLDCLAIFNSIESICLEKPFYSEQDNDDYKLVSDDDFVNKIFQAKTNFYRFLMEYYNVSSDELLKNVNKANKIMYLANRYAEGNLTNYENIDAIEYFQDLFYRFPLLEVILKENAVDYTETENVYERCNLKLSLD